MKKRHAVIVALVCAIIISMCGWYIVKEKGKKETEPTVVAQVEDETPEYIINEASVDVEAAKVKLGGKELTVPFAVSELTECGYTLERADSETVTYDDDNIAYYINLAGQRVTVNLGTQNEDGCGIEDSYVIDILADTGNTDSSDLEIYGGITLSSSIEDVVAVYGEPVFEFNGNYMYAVHINDSDTLDMACIGVMDGQIIRLEVCNMEDFVTQ